MNASELAERFGTPLYVYRLDSLRAAIADLRSLLPAGTRLYYSVKANPHPHLIGETVKHGLASEVSSSGELRAALLAGQDPAHIFYTGPGKTGNEMHDALRAGVAMFSVESEADYARLAAAANSYDHQIEYLVRINAGPVAGSAGLRMTGADSRFGFPLDFARSATSLLKRAGNLRPAGLHFFPVTNAADSTILVEAFRLSISSATQLMAETGLQARLVDIGGGFSAPFAVPGNRPGYAGLREALVHSLDEHLPTWRKNEPLIAFESGRYIVGDCGTLVTRVLDIKESAGTVNIVLDAGTNVLGGMSGLGRMLAPSVQPVSAITNKRRDVNIVGPLCTPLDVLSRASPIGVPRIGDVLEVPNVGAYGLTASLVSFLSRPLPAELVIEQNGSIVNARRLDIIGRELE